MESTRRLPPRRPAWLRLLIVTAVSAGIVAAALLLAGTDEDGDGAPIALPDLRNGRSFIQDNLWSTDTDQYAAWIAPDDTPYVGKRTLPDGGWQTVSLAAVAGNPLAAPVADDEHNVLAVGVDSLGYVHVAGNMHDDALRYVRSTRPNDITTWEPAQVAGPADRVTYPAFVALPDGTLQFWRREGMSGAGRVAIDTLAPGTRKWRHLGAVLDGTTSDESPYLHHIAIGDDAVVHLLFEWRGTGDVTTTNDVGYARSRDGGATWETSDGRRLSTPITHATAETLIDTAPTGSGLTNGGGLAVDRDGRPHGVVVINGGGEPELVHVWFDGEDWQRSSIPGSTVAGRPALACLPDGTVWLLGVADGRVRAVDITDGDDGERHSGDAVPPGWEPVFDTQALTRRGTIEMLIPAGAEPRVVLALAEA